MPIFPTPEWWSALLAIILIDLVLAGDNAIVIGLAARNVPVHMQRRVILWGTFGAIAVRVALTAVVVWLLKIPGFLLIGGVALVWIGWKLTRDSDGDGHALKPASTVRGAVQTIIIADAVMGVDNVLAVGGAAHGSVLLVVLGLLISVPIVIYGSTLVLKLVDRYPVIVLLGAGVLGWTAAKMIATEPLLASWIEQHPTVRTALQVILAGALVTLPLWQRQPPGRRAQWATVAFMVVWLWGFGVLEDRMGTHYNLLDHWLWDDELVDLVRWIGWIAPALWLYKRMTARAEKQLAATRI